VAGWSPHGSVCLLPTDVSADNVKAYFKRGKAHAAVWRPGSGRRMRKTRPASGASSPSDWASVLLHPAKPTVASTSLLTTSTSCFCVYKGLIYLALGLLSLSIGKASYHLAFRSSQMALRRQRIEVLILAPQWSALRPLGLECP
jgi:hypothetical protein